MRINLAGSELHNMVTRKGALTSRRGLYSVKTPAADHRFVGGFSIESPFTTEVWHYLFEQDVNTAVARLVVYTEDFYEMYQFRIGTIKRNPVITHAVFNNQIIINSPSFPSPIYGVVGGGAMKAVKTESENPDTTALEIPAGHICSFGDRMPIAQGNLIYFNDPDVDPRTYVAQNIQPLAGTIYDIFQSLDGSLYAGTSAGVFYIPQDALGQAQTVQGFVGLIPGIELSRPRNMAVSNGVVMALQRDGLVVVGGRGAKIDVAPYKGPRFFSRPIEVDDYRLAGEIFATPTGFLVGFRGQHGHVLDFNLVDNYQSYIWAEGEPINLVGTLRSREGDMLMVLENHVVMPVNGPDKFGTATNINAVAAKDVDLPEGQELLIRRAYTSSDNIGDPVRAYIARRNVSDTVPTRTGDIVIDSSTWDNTKTYKGRVNRQVRHSLAARAGDLPSEVSIIATGFPRHIEASVQVGVKGQGRRRGDKR
jgi:hypothetical protein